MIHRTILAAPVVIATSMTATCIEAAEKRVVFKSPDVRKAMTDHENAIKKLDESFNAAQRRMDATYATEAAKHRDALLEQLTAAQTKATKEADLDEAIRLRDAITRIQATRLVPPTQRSQNAAGDRDLDSENARLKKEITRLQAAQNAATPKVKIPREAVAFNNHHYLVVEAPATWHVAQQMCFQMGGHLARVESLPENAFIHRLIASGKHAAYHIDGSDEHTEGQWIFSNGQRMTVFNWERGSPNNTGDDDHHIDMLRARGDWGDNPAGVRYGFVCEWDQ